MVVVILGANKLHVVDAAALRATLEGTLTGQLSRFVSEEFEINRGRVSIREAS